MSGQWLKSCLGESGVGVGRGGSGDPRESEPSFAAVIHSLPPCQWQRRQSRQPLGSGRWLPSDAVVSNCWIGPSTNGSTSIAPLTQPMGPIMPLTTSFPCALMLAINHQHVHTHTHTPQMGAAHMNNEVPSFYNKHAYQLTISAHCIRMAAGCKGGGGSRPVVKGARVRARLTPAMPM